MSLNKFNTILFDLDGTLVDSIDLIVYCFQESLKNIGGIEISRDHVLERIGRPLRPQLKELCPENFDLVLSGYRKLQFDNHDQMVKPFISVPPTIKSLAEKGYNLGIVTSKGRAGTEAALNLMPATRDYFKVIITADDSLTHKPEPEPLLQAATALNVSPESCYYVGDTIFDMQAAQAAGMKPIGVLWGVSTACVLGKFTDLIFDSLDEGLLDRI